MPHGATGPESRPPARVLLLVACGVLALATVAVFWPLTNNGFVAFDDDANIYLNKHLGGLSGDRAHWAFTTHDYLHRYMPLGWLTYSAAFSLWGLDAGGYHFGAIIVHAVNSVLLFLVLRGLGHYIAPTRDPRWRHAAAFIVALWWTLHPMRVEVVAWATCLTYGVSQTLILLAFAACLATEDRTRGRFQLIALHVGAGTAFIAMLLVYPAGAGALAFIVAFDLFRSTTTTQQWSARAAQFWSRLRVKLPWILPALALVALSFLVTRASEPSDTGLQTTSTLSRVMRVPLMLAHQLFKPWWPASLSPTDDLLIDVSATDPLTLGSAALVAALTAVVLFRATRGHCGGLALWLAFTGVLLPLCGITQVVQFPGDRYGYFAAASLSVALFAVLLRLRRSVIPAAGTLVVFTLAWLPATRTQLTVWHDTESLLQHSLAHLRKDSYLPSVLVQRMAKAQWAERGDRATVATALAEAERRGWNNDPSWQDFRATIAAQEPAVTATGVPPLAWDHHGLGRHFAARGELREAFVHFHAALQLAPGFAAARADLEILAPGSVTTSRSPASR